MYPMHDYKKSSVKGTGGKTRHAAGKGMASQGTTNRSGRNYATSEKLVGHYPQHQSSH